MNHEENLGWSPDYYIPRTILVGRTVIHAIVGRVRVAVVCVLLIILSITVAQVNRILSSCHWLFSNFVEAFVVLRCYQKKKRKGLCNK